jgi:WD40 repeat protein
MRNFTPANTTFPKLPSRHWINLLSAVFHSTSFLTRQWFQPLALKQLTQLAMQGNPLAAGKLADLWIEHQDNRLLQSIEYVIQSSEKACVVLDILWEKWFLSRSEGLGTALSKRRIPANQPAYLRAISLLNIGQSPSSIQIDETLIHPLVELCEDLDPKISSQATEFLNILKRKDAISLLCAVWASNRTQKLEKILRSGQYFPENSVENRVLVGLKFGYLDKILAGSSEIVIPLINALQDVDPEISAQANLCLHNLRTPSAMDAFCHQWEISRDPFLENILIDQHYLANSPPVLRFLSALKIGKMEIIYQCPPNEINDLLQVCQDQDSQIREIAMNCAQQLRSQASINIICQRVLDQEDTTAREIALRAGYLPETSDKQALYLMLTEQWQKYEALDFDQRILRAVYLTASPELQKRIIHKIQVSGKSAYLNILLGSETSFETTPIREDESELAIRLLANNKEWEKLWKLSFQLTFRWSKQIITLLTQEGWQPDQEDERLIFTKLKSLTNKSFPSGLQEEFSRLRMAVPRANIKVSGRINSLDFSSNGNLLAIGTGNGRVILWDVSSGKIIKRLPAFEHSISHTRFNSEDVLFISERSARSSKCGIFSWEKDHLTRIGSHQGSVTVAEPIGTDQVFTAGRDSRLILWKNSTQAILAQSSAAFWPRASCLSLDDAYLALLDDDLHILSLNDFSLHDISATTMVSRKVKKSPARAAIYFPGKSNALIVGQYNGQVFTFINSRENRVNKMLLTQHKTSITALRADMQRKRLITASQDGRIQFLSLPDFKLVGEISKPSGSLTSLHISPNGSFMATGSKDSEIILWDLRVQDLPEILSKPLCAAKPADLTAILPFTEITSFPPAIINAIQFVSTLLIFRFRFDVQLDNLSVIRPGEFDIIIDK